MAAQIRLLQLGIALVNLVIAGLAITSIWPFPSGQLGVDLPSPNEISWNLDNGILSVTAPFSIDNGGFYDVEDLSVHFKVTNLEYYVLAEENISLGTVEAGTVLESDIVFQFDIQEIYDSGAADMIFEYDLLMFVIDVSCLYTMGLVDFDASYSVSYEWSPLVLGYGVDWQGSQLPPDPPPYSLLFWLNTSPMLGVVPAADVTMTVVGQHTGPAATGSTTVVLGGNHTSTVVFDTSALLGYTTFDAVDCLVVMGGLQWHATISIPGGSL